MVIIPEPELAVLAGLYLRILTIGAPGYALFEAGKRFVQAQGIFAASTYVLMICAPLNALLNYVLVWVGKFLFLFPFLSETTDMEIASKVWVWVCGCADVGGYCGLADAVVAVLVRAIRRRVRVLGRVYKARIRELGANGTCIYPIILENAGQQSASQIKLSIPGLVMVEAEFLAFEMLTLFSSYFGTAHLAAQSVLVTATSITFQLGFALSIASSTRVANFLGATLEDAARTAAHTGFIAAGIIGLFNFCLMTSIRSRFALLFTDDPEIIGYVVQVMPLTALFQCVDAISAMGSGILRGQGMNTPYPFSFISSCSHGLTVAG